MQLRALVPAIRKPNGTVLTIKSLMQGVVVIATMIFFFPIYVELILYSPYLKDMGKTDFHHFVSVQTYTLIYIARMGSGTNFLEVEAASVW